MHRQTGEQGIASDVVHRLAFEVANIPFHILVVKPQWRGITGELILLPGHEHEVNEFHCDRQLTEQDALFQELDAAKNVVFQWRSWDHFQITDMFGRRARPDLEIATPLRPGAL